MNGLKLWRQTGFRNFLVADMIGGFGVGLTTVGANWYVLQLTHSNQMVGQYLTINVLAGFFMAPLAGILTDRFSRQSVILWTFLGRALPMVVIVGLIATTGFNFGTMVVLAIVTGAGWITYMAASRSYIQAILPDELLGAANSFVEVSLQVGMFAAGAVAGLILNVTGFAVILGLNVALFIVAAGLIKAIPKSSHQSVSATTATDSLSFMAGLRYLVVRPVVLSLGLISILPLIVTQLFNVSAPDYVATILKANSVIYGLVDMGYGLGGLAAGLMTGWLLARRHEKALMMGFFGLATLGLFTLVGMRLVSLTIGCTFLLGLSNSALRVIINTVLMTQVDPQYMGRATSIWNGLSQLIAGGAATLMGIANDAWGANFGFLWMAVIMVIGLIWSGWLPRFESNN